MLGKRIVHCILMAVILLSGSRSAYAATPPPELAGLRQTVLALDSAWNRALTDLQQKKQDGALAVAERKDYAKFITFLSGRIQKYCQELIARGGPSAITDLPCPDDQFMGAGTGTSSSLSTTEEVAKLDKSLSETFGEFDELLLKEEQRIAARMPRERESGGTYGESQVFGREGSQAGAGGGGTGGTQDGDSSGGLAGSGNQNTGQGSGQSHSGGSQQSTGTGQGYSGGSRTGQGASPSAGGAGAGSGQAEGVGPQEGMQNIESGYDDIVARQLREAAEKETDPELKEKLWEEYRKYKEGIL